MWSDVSIVYLFDLILTSRIEDRLDEQSFLHGCRIKLKKEENDNDSDDGCQHGSNVLDVVATRVCWATSLCQGSVLLALVQSSPRCIFWGLTFTKEPCSQSSPGETISHAVNQFFFCIYQKYHWACCARQCQSQSRVMLDHDSWWWLFPFSPFSRLLWLTHSCT